MSDTAAPRYTSRDRPWCQFQEDGTVALKGNDDREILRLTFAAAEDLAEAMASCASAGRKIIGGATDA